MLKDGFIMGHVKDGELNQAVYVSDNESDHETIMRTFEMYLNSEFAGTWEIREVE